MHCRRRRRGSRHAAVPATLYNVSWRTTRASRGRTPASTCSSTTPPAKISRSSSTANPSRTSVTSLSYNHRVSLICANAARGAARTTRTGSSACPQQRKPKSSSTISRSFSAGCTRRPPRTSWAFTRGRRRASTPSSTIKSTRPTFTPTGLAA